VFAEVPDPRDPKGRIYPLPAVLTLLAVAMLGGATCPAAAAQFAEDRPALAEALGFRADPVRRRRRRRFTPGPGQLHYLLKALSAEAVEAALARWLSEACGGEPPGGVLPVDGKTLRGSRRAGLPGLHLLSAFSPALGAALVQRLVSADTNEHKAALEMLRLVPLEGSVITGDAALAQRDLCAAVVEGGGDYFLTVKDNQKSLVQDVRAAFGAAFSPSGTVAAGA
jgi:hypothetical protein